MKSKLISLIILFNIIRTEIEVDEPKLIQECTNNIQISELSNKYKNYISELKLETTIILTKDINKAKKYCETSFCIESLNDVEYIDGFTETNNTLNFEKSLTGNIIHLKSNRNNENNVFICFFKTKINGNIIQQYDITKKIVCKRIIGNKCKIIYGKNSRKLFESEKRYIHDTINQMVNNNIIRQLKKYN